MYGTERQERVALTDLVRDLFAKVHELINTQIELAKAEVKVGTKKMAMAAVFGVAALIIGTTFVLLLAVSLILLFSKMVEPAWASVITTGIFLVLTGITTALMLKEVRKNSETIDVDV
jgi:uncharacterized membrane protein YqjE